MESYDIACKNAAAGIRAITIVLLLPAGFLAYGIITDFVEVASSFRRLQLQDIMLPIGALIIACIPSLALWLVSRAVRRGTGWAIVVASVLVGLVCAGQLFMIFSLSVQWFSELNHPASGYEKNLVKFAAIALAILILAIASVRSLVELRRASLAVQAAKVRGFAIEIAQPVLPLDR